MNVIYENDKIIIINKKAGQLTQSNKSFDLDLTSEVLSYRRKKGEAAYAAVINRLDRPVSGLVIFAKDKAEAARLTKNMQSEGFCKQYYALICGKIDTKADTLVDYLLKDAKNNTSSVVDKSVNGAKRAELEYEVVKEYETEAGDFSLVRIKLITGRHHQIRVQFSNKGYPIAGDVKYGGLNAANADGILRKNEIALCAYSVTIDKKTYSVKPDWFAD